MQYQWWGNALHLSTHHVWWQANGAWAKRCHSLCRKKINWRAAPLSAWKYMWSSLICPREGCRRRTKVSENTKYIAQTQISRHSINRQSDPRWWGWIMCLLLVSKQVYHKKNKEVVKEEKIVDGKEKILCSWWKNFSDLLLYLHTYIHTFDS